MMTPEQQQLASENLPLTFFMLDFEAGWKSFLHMKLAKDFPIFDPQRYDQNVIKTRSQRFPPNNTKTTPAAALLYDAIKTALPGFFIIMFNYAATFIN